MRVIENLSAQAHALADASGRESERVTGLEGITRQIEEALAGLAQRQGSGAAPGGERHKSHSLVGKSMVPEGLAHRTSFKQWSRRYKLVAGAKDERFKMLPEWVEARKTSCGRLVSQHS